MKLLHIMIMPLLVILLANCTDQGGAAFNKQQAGTVIGALGGAAVGSQFGGGSGRVGTTAIGALLGGLLGSSVGKSMDRSDLMYYDRSSQSILETTPNGRTTTWRNPDSNVYGTITPTRTYSSAGTYCREYSQSIYVGGRKEQSYGTACRQPDGTWQVVG
jgi:surface antigen